LLFKVITTVFIPGRSASDLSGQLRKRLPPPKSVVLVKGLWFLPARSDRAAPYLLGMMYLKIS